MTTTAIGFASKYYTLWEISEDKQDLGNGRFSIITHHTYIKNISFDRQTAIEKYPDAIIDETLKGKTQSWDSVREVWESVDVFRFGKYKYMKITDADIDYLAWYWGQITGEHQRFVGDILVQNGYEIRHQSFDENSLYLMSPECLENERAYEAEYNAAVEMVKSHKPITVLIEANPDEDGYYYSTPYLAYHFPEVQENYYRGYSYYLPVVNGKQKRIKNKNIIISDYTYSVDDNDIIKVEFNKFEILKK
jgi:hypothetical protein